MFDEQCQKTQSPQSAILNVIGEHLLSSLLKSSSIESFIMSTRVLRGTLLSGIKHSTHHVPKKPRGVTRQGHLRSSSLTHRRQRVYASTVEESETFEDMCDQVGNIFELLVRV